MSAEYKLICHAECFADKVVNHDRQIGRVRRNGADTNIQRLRKKLCAIYVILNQVAIFMMQKEFWETRRILHHLHLS